MNRYSGTAEAAGSGAGGGRRMIQTVWPYLAVMLLAAGLFPALERRFGWRVFSVMPPIVWTYLLVTALAVAGSGQQRRDPGRAARADRASSCRRCCSC